MPLIVHPSSTCDVCLEFYSWSSASEDTSKPYAIACGHVFCLGCLQRMQPSTCPLCRKAFLPDRVKKLHIDRPPTFSENDDSVRANELLQRVSLASGENVPEEEVMGVISEAQQWLATRDDQNHIVYKPLRVAVTALHRWTSTQKETHLILETMEQQSEEFRKYIHTKEHDLMTSRAVEENLIERMERLEDEYKTKLARAEKSMVETDTELAHLRAEHANFRAQLARYQTKGNLTPSTSQTLPADWVPTYMRTPRSAGRSSVHSAVMHSTEPSFTSSSRNSTRMPVIPPVEPPTMPVIQEIESPEIYPRRKASRAPGIIPGAPASKRVVPPPPVLPNDKIYPAVAPIVEPFGSDRNSQWSDRTPRGEADAVLSRTPNYGYVVGGGYVPLSQPSLAALSEVQDTRAVGLMLYSEEEQASSSSDGQTNTVEAAARALGVASGEIETAETTWGHVRRALRHSIPWNESTTSIATTVATSTSTDSASDTSTLPSASASMTDFRILGAPLTSQNTHALGPARTIPRGGASSSEPSLVSTWGTVPSARTSRSSGLGDLGLTGLPSSVNLASEAPSRNSSLADLHLTNLPAMRSYSSFDTTPATSHHADMFEARPETPRAMPRLVSSSGRVDETAAPEAPRQPPRFPGQGPPPGAVGQMMRSSQASDQLGGVRLMLSPTNANATGQEDIDQVDESLRQLLSEERNRASRRRHSRHASISALDDQSRSLAPTADSRLTGNILDNAPVQSTTFARSFSGTSMSLTSQYDGTSGSLGIPTVGTTDPGHSHHRRRHTSVAGTSAPISVQGRGAPTQVIQQEPHSVREVQAVPSVASPAFQGHPVVQDPSSPLGVAATQSRDNLIGGSSLLLSFAPPSTSTAATSTGEPSAIHAPRPVDRRHSSNLFGLLNPRNRR